MRLWKAASAVLCVGFLGATFSPSANADDRDKKTKVTFSGPVEIPGVHLEGWGVLPAGTYMFKLLESSSNRHIVQIFNEDGTKIYATILAIANYRLTPTNKTVITFNEGVRGKPEALRAWFYPGANWGEEFVYPKAKAVELASVSKLPVLAVVADVKVEVSKPEELEVAEVLTKAPVMAIRPTGEEVEIAQVIQTEAAPVSAQVQADASPVTETATTHVAESSLPATASSVPLIALFGLLALSGAFAIRSMTKRPR